MALDAPQAAAPFSAVDANEYLIGGDDDGGDPSGVQLLGQHDCALLAPTDINQPTRGQQGYLFRCAAQGNQIVVLGLNGRLNGPLPIDPPAQHPVHAVVALASDYRRVPIPQAEVQSRFGKVSLAPHVAALADAGEVARV